MTRGLIFPSGTSMKGSGTATVFSATAPAESQKGSVAVTLTSHFVRAMLSRPVAQRAFSRKQIVSLLAKARGNERYRCIDQLLHVCVAEGGPDGLDAAIDVLARTGSVILAYAWDYLQRDIGNWEPTSDRAYQPNDDYWYVLLRAVARAEAPQEERFLIIRCCANAESRGIREGVVEGLHDLATDKAKDRLRTFAAEDEDAYIRQVAREALDDLEN